MALVVYIQTDLQHMDIEPWIMEIMHIYNLNFLESILKMTM